MNSIYEDIRVDETGLNPIGNVDEGYTSRPLGTFAGTIYKVLYRSNGKLIPSDTSDQLIFDSPK
jgi:hypothetical protein